MLMMPVIIVVVALFLARLSVCGLSDRVTMKLALTNARVIKMVTWTLLLNALCLRGSHGPG